MQYIDATRIGALTLLEEEVITTEFARGTKVSVPVQQKDLKKIIQSLSFYLTFTKSKFNIVSKSLKELLELKLNIYNYFGKDWAFALLPEDQWRYWQSESKEFSQLVIIYDIPYKLDLSLLYSSLNNIKDNVKYYLKNNCPYYIDSEKNYDLFFSFIESLSYYSFEIKVPIGTLDISASRETLQYTNKTCEELYKYLYKFFIEFYKNLRIDLINHPNFVEASINYSKYPDKIRRNFLNNLLWEPDKLSFDKSYSVFENTIPEDFKVYKIDKCYSSKVNEYIDVLKKIETNTIYTGHHKYILCVQDSSYKNYCKYIKYYIQKHHSSNKFNTTFLCISSKHLKDLKSWITTSLDTVYLSNIITEFNIDNPTVKKEQIDTSLFKVLRLSETKQRSRAQGIAAWCQEIETLKNPAQVKYYIDESELLGGLPLYLKNFVPEEYTETNTSNLINRISNYLSYKEISIHNVCYINRKTKNFKHKNWVNLLNVIKEDYYIYESQLDTLAINLFIYNFIKHHKDIFTLFDYTKLSKKNSLYNYLNKQYREAKEYLDTNKGLKVYGLLINSNLELMKSSLKKTYLKNFDDFNVPLTSKNKCVDIYNEYYRYLDKLPFLKYYNMRGVLNNVDISKKDFLFYINVMEEKLNLYKEETLTKEIVKSQYKLLEKQLFNKYNIKEIEVI